MSYCINYKCWTGIRTFKKSKKVESNEGSGPELTLYQSLFEIQISICDRFQMNPFQLDKENAIDIIILINNLTDYNERQHKNEDKTYTKSDGTKVIERPAGDNWF